MRLVDLKPIWKGKPYRADDGALYSDQVDSIDDAGGVQFLCPVCFQKNLKEKGIGTKGTHIIRCWTPEVSQDHLPNPGRWNLNGTGFDDLTLTGANGKGASVQLTGGCHAHFFIKLGVIELV